MQFDPEKIYELSDENQHFAKWRVIYICTCGETKTEFSDIGYENHSYNSDGICACGANKEHHHSWEMLYSPETIYEYVNDQYHLAKWEIYYKCTDCGEIEVRYSEIGNQNHEYNESSICICGNLKQPEIIDEIPDQGHICEPGEVIHWYGIYGYVSNTQHYQHHVTLTKCAICQKELSRTNVIEYVDHEFKDGECIRCGALLSTENNDYTEVAKERINNVDKCIDMVGLALKNNDINLYQFDELLFSGKDKTPLEDVRKSYEDVLTGNLNLGDVPREKYIYYPLEHSFANGIKDKLTSLGYTQLVSSMSGSDNDWNSVVAYYQAVNGLEVSGYLDYDTIMKVNNDSNGNKKFTSKSAIAQDSALVMITQENDNFYYTVIVPAATESLYGNYYDGKVNLAGVVGEIIVGELPIAGTIADLRDVWHDIDDWEWSWKHVGQTAVDAVGLIPIIGCLKYSDEVSAAFKGGTKLTGAAAEVSSALLKNSNNADEIIDATKTILKHSDDYPEFLKYSDEAAEALKDVSKIVVKESGSYTSAAEVIAYHKKFGKLPGNFVTKEVAIASGWKKEIGNLAEVLPGKSIGGNIYKNGSKALPDSLNRVWYEADLEYVKDFRGKLRLLYSNDGLYYLSNHYLDFVPVNIPW
jgi:hypothetical protein